MSESKRIIEIKQPFGVSIGERHVERHLECVNCRGRGVFFSQVSHDEYDECACSICQGSGYLKAEITITYSPDTDIY